MLRPPLPHLLGSSGRLSPSVLQPRLTEPNVSKRAMSTVPSNPIREANLVSCEWLYNQGLGDARVKILDASYFLPHEGRNAKQEFLEKPRIPSAAFFDIDEIADSSSGLPHMLPSPERFSEAVSGLGIGNGDRVVIYDSKGIFSSCRAWWTFKVFGHDDVAVLDGGLKMWLAKKYTLQRTAPTPPPKAKFEARFRPELIRDMQHIKSVIQSNDANKEAIIDGRPSNRFRGLEDEPRPGLRRGNIPGSVNVPFMALLTPDGTFKSDSELRGHFAEIPVERPIIASCGSGITACVDLFALHLIGRDKSALYDGSWAEFGDPTRNP